MKKVVFIAVLLMALMIIGCDQEIITNNNVTDESKFSITNERLEKIDEKVEILNSNKMEYYIYDNTELSSNDSIKCVFIEEDDNRVLEVMSLYESDFNVIAKTINDVSDIDAVRIYNNEMVLSYTYPITISEINATQITKKPIIHSVDFKTGTELKDNIIITLNEDILLNEHINIKFLGVIGDYRLELEVNENENFYIIARHLLRYSSLKKITIKSETKTLSFNTEPLKRVDVANLEIISKPLHDVKERKIIIKEEIPTDTIIVDGKKIDLIIKNDKYTYKDGYDYYSASIKNLSNYTLSYIKVDVFLYDGTGVMIDSIWTNWSGTLPSNGSITVDKMMKHELAIRTFKSSISDIGMSTQN